MTFAGQAFDLDDGLATLTEMIVSEVGPPAALADGETRAAAVARVERLLASLLERDACDAVRLDDLDDDILFGRMDAEVAFGEHRR
jgi:hypothetical protein